MHVDIRIGAAHVSSRPVVTKVAEASQRTESGPPSRRSSPMPSPRTPPLRPLRRVRHGRRQNSQERAADRTPGSNRWCPAQRWARSWVNSARRAAGSRYHQGRGDHRPVVPVTRQRVRVRARRIVGQYGHLGVRQACQGAAAHPAVPPRGLPQTGSTVRSAGTASRPATSSYGTARASASDQPSGKGLPGSRAAPTTISRARQTVRHTTEKDEHPRGLSRPLRPSPDRAARAAGARHPAPAR